MYFYNYFDEEHEKYETKSDEFYRQSYLMVCENARI